MKERIKSIAIKEPCLENWDDMAIYSTGKFCRNCQKNVIDFTGLTNSEILSLLSNTNHLCGRFETNQLSQLNYSLTGKTSFSWKRFSAMIAFLGLAGLVKAEERFPFKTEQSSDQNKKQKITDTTATISGTITAADDSLPMPGVQVKVKGTNIFTTANTVGKFKLDLTANADTLEFSFIGYQTIDVKIDKFNAKNIVIAMVPDGIQHYGDIVVGSVFVRRSFSHRIWRKITKPIQAIFGK